MNFKIVREHYIDKGNHGLLIGNSKIQFYKNRLIISLCIWLKWVYVIDITKKRVKLYKDISDTY